MSKEMGPKERALRESRERDFEDNQRKMKSRPSATELRQQIAKVKGGGGRKNKGGGRGR
jgi:hypothetical protein